MPHAAFERAVVNPDLPVGARAWTGVLARDGHLVFAFELTHLVSESLRLAANVGKHQLRSNVPADLGAVRGDLRERRHRAGERRADRESHRTQPALVDDRAFTLDADQKRGDAFERRDGGRKPDTRRRRRRERLQRLEAKRKIRAALVAGERVDFVDDDGFDVTGSVYDRIP